MRYSTPLLSAFALSVTEVAAFPSGMVEAMARAQGISEGEVVKRQTLLFDPETQYVSNTGEHAWVAPDFDAGDQRGPCPGLNAMANHNYLPHNGVATIQQFINGTNEVFGMGVDLGSFLSIYGAVFDGDLTGWSIGGPSPALEVLPIGLLSQPQGISGSHNKYETDVSPTRGDLYEYGNDYKIVASQFEDLFSRQPDAATANYDLDVLTEFRNDRFQQSIQNNPYFFNGPFSGVIVQPAAYTFIYRFMANKSAEVPEGILNQEVLKSFFGVEGEPGNFVINFGYERIPDNWYKRAIGDEYTIPYFATDLNVAALKYPEFLSIGGNTGTTKSFTGVDISDLSGGLFKAQTFLQGNNFACFAFEFAQMAAPDLLAGIFLDVSEALGDLSSAIGAAETSLGGCPQLQKVDDSQFSQFPGATSTF